MSIDPNAAPTAMQPDGRIKRLNAKYLHVSDHAGEDWRLINPNGPEAAAHITRLEADLREARMQVLASDGQAQEAYEAQTLLEAEVARQGKHIGGLEYSDGDAEHWRYIATRLEAEVARLTKERDDLMAANDAIEIDAGLAVNGNLWRYWSGKSQTLAAQNKAMREALESLNTTDQELIRIHNKCTSVDGDVKIWSRMLLLLVDYAISARATLSSIKEPTT